MKNSLLSLFAICMLLNFYACTADDEGLIEDSPITIERFQINNELFNLDEGTITVSRNESFRFSLDLIDEGLIKSYEAYILINDDLEKRWSLTPEYEVETSIMHWGYNFADLREIFQDGGTYFETEAGDALHFYINVADDTENETNIYFKANLID